MSSVFANFDSFSSLKEKIEFLNEVITKQIELSLELHNNYPDKQDFHRHLLMLIKVKSEPNFIHELAAKLTGEITISQLSRAFADLLGKWIDRYLLNGILFIYILVSNSKKKK